MTSEDDLREALDYLAPVDDVKNDYNDIQSVVHSWDVAGETYYVTSHGEIYRKGDIPVNDELITDASVGSELLHLLGLGRKTK